MEKNKMSEMLEQIINILRRIRLTSVNKQYFSVPLDSVCMMVDWNIGSIDIPESIRFMIPNDKDDEPGYLACIRFDVASTKDTNGAQQASFVFDEAEYDLEDVKDREELLRDILDELNIYYPDVITFDSVPKEMREMIS